MEKVDKTLDTTLVPLLDRQVYTERGQSYIKLDETPCIYKDSFRFYFVVRDESVASFPELYNRTLVLNFSVSQEAISAQLMHLLANLVDRDSEETKIKQILKNAENRTSKNKKENDILDHIKKLGDKILDDQTLVNTLSEYRSFIDRVESELRIAKVLSNENHRLLKIKQKKLNHNIG